MPVTMRFVLLPASRLLALLHKYYLGTGSAAASCCQDPSIDWVKRMVEWTGLEPEVVTYGTK